MAWTAPRTWVTGENVTAALMNVHVRDNFLVTAPAQVTTAGDIVYATGANALTRLALGGVGGFLRGGSVAPIWTNVLGDTATNANFVMKGPASPDIRWNNTGASDPADEWRMASLTSQALVVDFIDDSASTDVDSLSLQPNDFILHTGDKGTGAGAVVIGTDTGASPTAVTTGGSNYLSVSITTGGPAFVEGLWQVSVKRTSAASTSTLDVLPRDDGANLSPARFAYDTPNPIGDGDLIPAANDEMPIVGTFFVRHTATNTSAYQIFVSAGANSRFELQGGFLYVRSIQYPT